MLSLSRLKQVKVLDDLNTSLVHASTIRARARTLLESSSRPFRIKPVIECIIIRVATTVCPRSWVGGSFEAAGFASLVRNPVPAQCLVTVYQETTVRQVANGLVRQDLALASSGERRAQGKGQNGCMLQGANRSSFFHLSSTDQDHVSGCIGSNLQVTLVCTPRIPSICSTRWVNKLRAS